MTDPTPAADVPVRRDAVAVALRLGVCPACGRELTPTDRYGSGRLADGIFCSLGCYAGYRYGRD